MNCKFCQHELQDTDGIGYFICKHHNDVEVSFLCSGNAKEYKIWYTGFIMYNEVDTWEISFSHKDNVCSIIRHSSDTAGFTDSVLKLDFLPEYITPENAREKLKTLLTFS